MSEYEWRRLNVSEMDKLVDLKALRALAERAKRAQSQVYAVSSGNPWSTDDCVSAPAKSVRMYGASEQSGVPSPDNPIPIKCNNLTYTVRSDDPDFDGGSVTAPELCAIGDVRDEFDAVTGKGIRRIKKLVLDGTENWTIFRGSSSYYFEVPKPLRTTALSTHFSYTKYTYVKLDPGEMVFGANNAATTNLLFNYDNLAGGIAGWKSYLSEKYAAGDPVEVYYILETPTEFTTEPTQLATPNGYCQIIPSGDGVAGDVEVEYAIDIEKRYVPKNDFEDIFISMTSPIMRRNIYRGKDLGTEVTDAQRNAIASGTFDGLFIGDYWTINGTKYLIADMDYWYNTGDIAFVRHHLVMIPGVIMYNRTMNDTRTAEGGYVGSLMYTEGLNQAKGTINAAFGNMVLTHREYLTNSISGNHALGGAWYDSSVELMNEIMVYGSNVYNNIAGSIDSNRFTVDKQQLAIFKLNPKEMEKRQSMWLRDIMSSTFFASLNNNGLVYANAASSVIGVRPVFPIG